MFDAVLLVVVAASAALGALAMVPLVVMLKRDIADCETVIRVMDGTNRELAMDVIAAQADADIWKHKAETAVHDHLSHISRTGHTRRRSADRARILAIKEQMDRELNLERLLHIQKRVA